VSEQPPWDASGHQDPQPPYGQQPYGQGQPQHGQQAPGQYQSQPSYQGQPYGPPGGQPPYPGGQPGHPPAPGRSDDRPSEAPKREQWSAEDWRMLVITITGGLAANIGTVLTVGLGLAYLHWRHSQPNYSSIDVVTSALTFFVICTAGFAAVISWSRREKVKRHRPVGWLARPLAAVLATLMLVFLLVLVGVASGLN
jgi:hypothetical protein